MRLGSGDRLVIDARGAAATADQLAAGPALCIEAGARAPLRVRVLGRDGEQDPTLHDLLCAFVYLWRSASCPWTLGDKRHPYVEGSLESRIGVAQFQVPRFRTGNHISVWIDGTLLGTSSELDGDLRAIEPR
jgi:hypothetical protein